MPHLTRRMLAVALPLAVSAYARTSLTTLEHLLIPRGLKSSGLSADRALAGYGIVHGMAHCRWCSSRRACCTRWQICSCRS